ncbi:MAG: anti-sigma factor family protein [Trebonia sp.]
MSHLGELLSALVDGELSGAELDRVNAHVAACGDCRAEAGALRRLKHELRALAEVDDTGDITGRLLAMFGQDSQAPVRHLAREHGRRRARTAGRDALAITRTASPPRRLLRSRRRRYVFLSTVSLVVVGVGTAAFGMGGGSSSPAPRITPQLEVFDVQHAIVSGDVPFADPTDLPTRVPVGAATP